MEKSIVENSVVQGSQVQQQQSIVNQNSQNTQEKQESQQQPISEILKPQLVKKSGLQFQSLEKLHDEKNQLEYPIEQNTLQQTLKYEREKLNHSDFDNIDETGVIQKRNRIEGEIRIYKCGCGKKYQSYPALYTHIRSKHNGKPPAGTINQAQSNSKRGRPRRLEFGREDDNQSKKEPQQAQEVQNIMYKEKNNEKNIDMYKAQFDKEDIQAFLNTLQIQNDQNYDGKCDPQCGFVINKTCDTLNLQLHPFAKHIKDMQEGKIKDIQQNTTCDIIISLFLFNIAENVNDKLYKIIALFFRLLRECTNQNIQSVIQQEKSFKNMQKQQQGCYTEQQSSAKQLPLIGQKFILEFLPKQCPDMDQSFATFLFLDFCKWLLRKKYTNIKTEVAATLVDDEDYDI